MNERKKVAVIHQANFLPWLGFFNKLLYADNFIVLDNVQYNIREFHNRTHIKSANGDKIFLTLSVGKVKQNIRSKDVQVINENCITKIFRTIHHSYAKTKYYSEFWPKIKDAILLGYPGIVNININAIKAILHILNFTKIRIYLESEFELFKDSTDRLINLCKKTGCDRLIIGQGGSVECHNIDKIKRAGIELNVQEFYHNHPIYPQVRGKFVSHLSIIDALFNIGPDETLLLINRAWSPRWKI